MRQDNPCAACLPDCALTLPETNDRLISTSVDFPEVGISATVTFAGSQIIVSQTGDIALLSVRDFSKDATNVKKVIRSFAMHALNYPSPKAFAKLSSPAYKGKQA